MRRSKNTTYVMELIYTDDGVTHNTIEHYNRKDDLDVVAGYCQTWSNFAASMFHQKFIWNVRTPDGKTVLKSGVSDIFAELGLS